MALPNLGAHPDAVDMGTSVVETLYREIRSNSRDQLLEKSANVPVDVDTTAGGTIALTVEQQWASQLIRLTGTPGAPYTIQLFDGNRNLEFENVSGQTATIDTVTGAASPPTIIDGANKILFERGIEITEAARIGLQSGALLHSGHVNPTAGIPFADFELKRAHFIDYAFEVTSPTSSSGILVLDMELSNFFDVTLTEDVTTLTLDNPPDAASGLLLEDGSGRLLLEDGTGVLLQEETDTAGSIFFIVRQDTSGGWQITWPGTVIWESASGGSPAQTLPANAIDFYWLFTTDSGATWYGVVLGLDMK